MIKRIKNQYKGFTLIELLVVIGILAILLAIVLIAINPARQFAQANNTKRSSDVTAILNAIDQYLADNAGQLPPAPGMPLPGGAPVLISKTGADLCSLLATRYLAALPVDPTILNGAPVTDCTTSYNTGYTISIGSGSDNRVTIAASVTSLNAVISVTR